MTSTRALLWATIATAVVLPNPGCTVKADSAVAEKTTPMPNSPETRRVDQTDEYHGVKVEDPYRWLEDDVRESPEVAAWVKQQNAAARSYLDAIPERSRIIKRLTELWNYERYSPPFETLILGYMNLRNLVIQLKNFSNSAMMINQVYIIMSLSNYQ